MAITGHGFLIDRIINDLDTSLNAIEREFDSGAHTRYSRMRAIDFAMEDAARAIKRVWEQTPKLADKKDIVRACGHHEVSLYCILHNMSGAFTKD